jgi:hypothetical protein
MKRNPLLSENMWKDASGIIFSMLKIKRKPYSAEELMWLSLRNNNWMDINLEDNIHY